MTRDVNANSESCVHSPQLKKQYLIFLGCYNFFFLLMFNIGFIVIGQKKCAGFERRLKLQCIQREPTTQMYWYVTLYSHTNLEYVLLSFKIKRFCIQMHSQQPCTAVTISRHWSIHLHSYCVVTNVHFQLQMLLRMHFILKYHRFCQ